MSILHLWNALPPKHAGRSLTPPVVGSNEWMNGGEPIATLNSECSFTYYLELCNVVSNNCVSHISSTIVKLVCYRTLASSLGKKITLIVKIYSTM